MNPTDLKPLDTDLLELFQMERERPDLPDAMRDRILRGVEFRLGFRGGTGSGGQGPSSCDEPSGGSGDSGSTEGSVARTAGRGLAGLVGGILLAACLGVGEDSPSRAVYPELASSKEVVVASAAETDLVNRPKSTAPGPVAQEERSGVLSQSYLDQGLQKREVDAGVPGPSAGSEVLLTPTVEINKVPPHAESLSSPGRSTEEQLVHVERNNSDVSKVNRLPKQRVARERPSDDSRVAKGAAPLRVDTKWHQIRPTCPREPGLISGDGILGKGDVRGGAHAIGNGRSIAIDAEGNTIVAGWFTETIDLGDGPIDSNGASDVFLLKLDPSGKLVWSKTFGGRGPDQVLSVAVNCDSEIVVTGWFTEEIDFGSGIVESAGGKDVFVAKLDSDGEPLWSRHFGGEEDQVGSGVAVDSSENVIVTGTFEGELYSGDAPLVSAGGKDVFVIKLDSYGNAVWTRCFGDAADQSGLGVAVGTEGNIIMTGEFESTLDFGSGPLLSEGCSDTFVAEFDSSGKHLWSERFGDAAAPIGCDVAVNENAEVLQTDGFTVASDFGTETLKR